MKPIKLFCHNQRDVMSNGGNPFTIVNVGKQEKHNATLFLKRDEGLNIPDDIAYVTITLHAEGDLK